MPYLQVSIVVLREMLEIALILTILFSATKNIAKSKFAISIGLVLGIASSLTIAYFTDKISDALDGLGQEFFNGLILFTTSFMIGWTVIWMQKHAKTLTHELKQLGASVSQGKKHLYALSIVVLLTITREGSEIVLFCYGQYVSGMEKSHIAIGFAIGIFCGLMLSFALYFGLLLKSFQKHFFQITTLLLIFFASSLSATGAGFWVNANIISAIIEPVFDLSNIIPQKSFVGQVLHFFFGYIEKPSLAQLIAYFSTFSILFFGVKIAKKI